MCALLRFCLTRLSLWAALRKSSSVTPPSVCCAPVCSSPRARASCRTSSASYSSSTTSRSTPRRAAAGRASTSRRPHTAVCVNTRCSKETRGESNLIRRNSCVLEWRSTCCCFVLFSSLAGLEECWLLTERLICAVTLQLKVCTNLQCLAMHSFTDLHPGKHTHTQIIKTKTFSRNCRHI